jgi:hypothetical protein
MWLTGYLQLSQTAGQGKGQQSLSGIANAAGALCIASVSKTLSLIPPRGSMYVVNMI